MAGKVINTVLNLRDNMSGGLIKAAKNTKGVTKEMVSATREVERFKNKAISSVSSVVTSFAKLGTAAAGAVTALAVKTGLSEAMDLEGYRLQLETATKDTQKASEIMKYAIDLANRTPFEGGELVEAASKFEAMGMAAKQWLPLAGDMAAATNKSFDQATEALIDAQTGELERLKEFGITKAKIVEQGEKMFSDVQLVNNQGQIVNQEKFNEALVSLMQERFAGGMEKQAGTIKGLWSTVTGVTKSALSNMVGITTDGSVRTGSALELLKGGVSSLAGRLEQWQQDGTLDAIAQRLDQGIARAADFAGQAFQWLQANGDTLLARLKPLAATIAAFKIAKLGLDAVNAANNFALYTKTVVLVTQANIKATASWVKNTAAMAANKAGIIATTIASKAAAVGTGLLTAAQWALNAAFVATPIGWIVLGIMAVVAAGVALYKNWDTVKETASALWEKAKGVFGGIRDTVTGAFSSAKEAVGGFFDWIGDKLSWLDEKIEGIPVLGDLYKGVKGAGSWIADAIQGNVLGTTYFSGGLTRVNERGGEILDLPSGTRIIPHDMSQRMVSETIGKFFQWLKEDFIGRNNGLQGNALGTTYFSGGLTRVNERGGEILDLPSGTRIIPHDVSKRMASDAARSSTLRLSAFAGNGQRDVVGVLQGIQSLLEQLLRRRSVPSLAVYVTVQGNVIGNRDYADSLGNTIAQRILRALDNI